MRNKAIYRRSSDQPRQETLPAAMNNEIVMLANTGQWDQSGD